MPLCTALIEKCFGARPNTKSKAVDCLLMFIELENPEPVIVRRREGKKAGVG
jgi:hypothetical protein